METTFTHHPRVDGDFVFDANRTYAQGGPYQFKPHGFWLSVDDDWRRWCTDEQTGYADANPVTFSVDTGVCLWLKDVDDIDRFHAEFFGSTRRGIDWVSVSRLYAGLIIAPYQWRRRLDGAASDWYYGWDCASACVWDLSVLTPVDVEAVTA